MEKMITKIQNIQTFANRLACKGKLAFLRDYSKKECGIILFAMSLTEYPVIYSESENIEVGDFYLSDLKKIYQKKQDEPEVGITRYKVLIFPENFTERHQFWIQNRHWRDGDEFYIQAEILLGGVANSGIGSYNIIKLNDDGHASLYLGKPLEIAWDEIIKTHNLYGDVYEGEDLERVNDFVDFLKMNYHPPTPKNHE